MMSVSYCSLRATRQMKASRLTTGHSRMLLLFSYHKLRHSIGLNSVIGVSTNNQCRTKITETAQAKLHVGQTIVVNKSFTFDDVRQFAGLSHDTNPIHLNAEYAAQTRFGQRVVHGVLVLGFVSGVLGTQMPGIGTILLSHVVSYPNPTFIDDTVSCKAVIKEIKKGRRIIMHVSCTSLEQNCTVLEGDFDLLVTKEALGEDRGFR